ncbi:MAG TPA: hypothetical protein VLR94_06300 [Acidobacteriota bacterium]|nr:hypothetical protein [Acidobacteriota bacterium]
MTSRKKNRPGPGKKHSGGTGAANRKARTILIAVIVGIVLLMVLLFIGTYLHGPQP